MYIIQMADLHIGSANKCLEKESVVLSKAIDQIKQDIPPNQKLLISVCGDIIDSKNSSGWEKGTAEIRYREAADLFRLMQQELKEEYDVRIRFCLGNHDVTHMSEFLNFANEFDTGLTEKRIEDGYFMEWDEIYYIFLNSCDGRQYEYGCIDYAKVERILKELPENKSKMLVLHHTVMSMYEKDNSSIRNSAELLKLIQKYNVIGVLHGHIHGREQFLIGQKRCRIIGTGALFSRNNPDVNSQFNVIEVEASIFREISTYIYMADNRISGHSWNKISSEEDNNENYFRGDNFQDIYQKLIRKLAYRPVLNNVILQIDSSYEEFKSNLEKYLHNDELVIGQKHFSYFELAELWEKIEVPQCLYFNHGMYFKVKDKEKGDGVGEHGIQFIARQLKSKPTTNKAVLTTYGMDMVVQMLKGEEYLPSLLSIQFSQSSDGDTMFIHMYLRALEAQRFLKINICEIQWLLEHLKEQNVLFKKVNIAISAFRVQKRENFNCFLKADIDNIDDKDLTLCVYEGNTEEICRMLEEKIDASETITNVKGLKALCEAITVSRKHSKSYKYSEKVIDKLDEILAVYKKLDDIHRRGSIKTLEESQYETDICKGIGDVIFELKRKEDDGLYDVK